MGEIEEAEVAEITALHDLAKWREGSRVLVRRQQPHPEPTTTSSIPTDRCQPGHQAPITNSQDPDIAYLVAGHRLHAPEEDQINDAKDCGLANFPCHSIRANQVWLFLVQPAQTLLCWAKRLCLGPDFLLAPPKRLRLQVLQVAGAAGPLRAPHHPAARCQLALADGPGTCLSDPARSAHSAVRRPEVGDDRKASTRSDRVLLWAADAPQDAYRPPRNVLVPTSRPPRRESCRTEHGLAAGWPPSPPVSEHC